MQQPAPNLSRGSPLPFDRPPPPPAQATACQRMARLPCGVWVVVQHILRVGGGGVDMDVLGVEKHQRLLILCIGKRSKRSEGGRGVVRRGVMPLCCLGGNAMAVGASRQGMRRLLFDGVVEAQVAVGHLGASPLEVFLPSKG